MVRARVAGNVQGWGLIAIGLLPTLAIVSLVPNLPQLFQHFASVPGHGLYVPMILTMPSLCIAIFAPLAAGPLADLWGRRRLLLIGLLAYSLLGLLPLLLDNLFAIIASRAVVGLAEAAILTAGNALLGDYFEGAERRKWLGYQSVVGPIVASLIVLAGGALGDFSWRGPFVLYAVGLVVLAWAYFTMWEPTSVRKQGAGTSTAFPWATTFMVAAVTVGVAVVYFVQALQLGRIFAELGVSSPSRISIVVTIASVGIVIGGYFYRKVAARPLGQIFAIIFGAFAIGYVGLGLAPDYKTGLLFGVIAQFGNGVTLPTLIAWALSRYDFEHRGRGMGVWGGCFFVGTFLSPPIVSVIGRYTNSFLATVAVIGAICAGIALIALLAAGGASRRTLER
jgi:MFS family permease